MNLCEVNQLNVRLIQQQRGMHLDGHAPCYHACARVLMSQVRAFRLLILWI